MLTRICAGGVIFCNDRVFIMKNDKDEWVLPKGVVRNKEISRDVALNRVNHEAGVDAQIVSPAGETNYEFYSQTRKMPVCNKVDWFIMESNSEDFSLNKDEGFQEGGFFSIDEALEKITYSQDKSLVRLAYRKYNTFCKQNMTATGS
ncbi:MAG: NUDIX hydrolase [Firmicutes bacterium HGW-Firmicutes-12]|jgi:predicted NUDIX family NTP pyrophosphohydrolase|nr:MAG: NUDIX hydrolase [Firmicutes bacterium HGW-Firmicutes-12]